VQRKYIFITGGVVSSLGKGMAAASIASLLEIRGIRVTLLKMDPYINVDPGTMSPFQHGEVFVTDDGAETDLDLGHYERFTSVRLTRKNSFSAGQVYDSVITKERRGDYLGKTVQVIPHITDEIKLKIREASEGSDLALVEVGGTVGDIEGLPFMEAIRQFSQDVGSENVCYVHLSYVPYLKAAGELKTKPTQHSVKELRSIGIQPDIILCRSDRSIPKEVREKIALFCNVKSSHVFSAKDVETIYELPLEYYREGIDQRIVEELRMWTGTPNLEKWEDVVQRIKHPENETTIGIVGKYVDLRESYKSLSEALIHGGIANHARVNLKYIDSEKIEKGATPKEVFEGVDGILIPGGFGDRGIEGKVRAIEYARTSETPFLGICLGLQAAVIEFARNVCGITKATSREFEAASEFAVIDQMNDQKEVNQMGGTMRLGSYECSIKKGTKAYAAYQTVEISERHRHRYEVSNAFREKLEEGGLIISGVNPQRNLVEMIELPNHPWFVGCQFHPEFKSRPMEPHPLFVDFIKSSLHRLKD